MEGAVRTVPEKFDYASHLNNMYNTIASYGIKTHHDVKIATICSHSALQILDGAALEGFESIGICKPENRKTYEKHFRYATRKTNFMEVNEWRDILEPSFVQELKDEHAILVPHGSFVEYIGGASFRGYPVPNVGNRRSLEWEEDRDMQYEWLKAAGVDIPRRFRDPHDIDRPVLVKLHGAKGGKGAFIAKDRNEFRKLESTLAGKDYTIQEYIIGPRYYPHFFYSPIKTEGYDISEGTIEMLSIDRRDESNIDEAYKLGSKEELNELGILQSFVVTGNVGCVLRESFVPRIIEMGEKVIEKSLELFGGLTGPFCLEGVYTDDPRFRIFEVSSRIVAGTNVYPKGGPYRHWSHGDNASMGRRIAKEIKNAILMDVSNDKNLNLRKIIS